MKLSLPLTKPFIIVPALCALFALLCLVDAIESSAVADEIGGHMASGYLYWKTGSYSGGVMNFPLGHLIMGLPGKILQCQHTLFTEDYLLIFRLPILILGTLLGFCLYRFTDRYFGRGAALAALCAYCLSPNMIAHSSLATLDVPITAFCFFTIIAAWNFKRRPAWWRMVVLSVLLGCALTTKVQGVLLIPLCLIILSLPRPWIEADTAFGPPSGLSRRAPWWSAGLLILVPWFVIHAVYLHNPFSDGALLPPLYADALQAKLFHATGTSATGRDQIAYLMGEYAAEGWWYWFPVAILIKTPLPVLLLALAGVWRTMCRLRTPPPPEGTPSSPGSGRLILIGVVLPILLFLGAAMAARLNIGLRHVLIIYPFVFVLAGVGAVGVWRLPWGRFALGVLGAFLAVQTVSIAPHHLCFFNAATGGAEKGDEYLMGSNFDWGQSDHFLRDYVNSQDRAYSINPDPAFPTNGHILVKSTALRGAYGSGGHHAYAWLKRFEPVNRIAYCWYEYHVPADAFTGAEITAAPRGPLSRINAWRPWNPTVPPAERNPVLHELDRHLQENARLHAALDGPQYILSLASAYLVAGSYDNVLDLCRRLLHEHPRFDQSIALGLGSEVAVRWKVGILNFENDEYLAGFGTPDRAPGALSRPPGTAEPAALGRAARHLGIQSDFAGYHLTAGYLLEKKGRRAAAIEQYEWVLHFDPSQNPVAARARQRINALRE